MNWDEYFIDIAKVVASRSKCFRNKVGAVIVNDKDIISTGYNGTPKYQKNCKEIGFCYRDKYNIKSGTQLEKCRAVGSHAESNAVCLASRNGHSTNDATIYIIGHNNICNQCKAIIANANIKYAILVNPDNNVTRYEVKDWTVHSVDKEC